MSKYCYGAVFTKEESGLYSVIFPDLEGCYTSGDDIFDAIEMANDVLNSTLAFMEDKKMPIPQPSELSAFEVDNHSFASIMMADTTAYRKKTSSQAVKKTLSIPSYLNEAAESAGINFSQTLQEALAVKLGFAS